MIKKHFAAILFSILIGVGMLVPQWYFSWSLGPDYRGITIMGTDAETCYDARIKNAAEGGGVGNPFFLEEKDEVPPPGYVIAEEILALPLYVFDISVSQLSLIYLFFFPALIFLLVYAFLYRLIRDRGGAIAGAFLVVFGYKLLTLSGIFNLFTWSGAYEQFSSYARPVNPQFSSLFFFGYLHTLLTIWRRKSKNISIIWYALVLFFVGISFYIYFYTWTFFAVLSGLFVALLIWKKEYEKLKRVLIVLVGASLVGIPYMLELHSFTSHPYYADISKTFGLLYSHKPILSLAGIIVTILFLGTLWLQRQEGKETPKDVLFLGSVLLSTYIVINQQIITGILLQEGHYHWFFNMPIFGIILIWSLYMILKRTYPKIYTMFIWGLVVASVLMFILVQTSSYKVQAPIFSQEQSYMNVIQWLNENAGHDDVVLADNDLSDLIPIYTNLYDYWDEYGFTYLIPRERVMHALFTYLYLYDVDPATLPEAAYHPPIKEYSTAYQYREVSILLGDKKAYLNGFYPEDMAEQYKAIRMRPISEQLNGPYRVDYIIVTERTGSNWHKALSGFPIVFQDGSYTIYKNGRTN